MKAYRKKSVKKTIKKDIAYLNRLIDMSNQMWDKANMSGDKIAAARSAMISMRLLEERARLKKLEKRGRYA